MKHRAFLQKMGDEWFDEFVYICVNPLQERGFEIIGFDDFKNPLEDYRITKNDIVIGSVESCITGFKAMGIEPPKYLGYPEELKFGLAREITVKTKQELYGLEFPFFIKPKDGVKTFTGEVVLYKEDIDRILGQLPDDYEVYYCSRVIDDIQAEYRCFIHKGEIKGIQHYLGDVTIFPYVNLIKELISEYKTAPVAYTLDIAIRDEGFNFLLEVNDFWAVGSYGLNGTIYTRCYVDRWFEIIRNS